MKKILIIGLLMMATVVAGAPGPDRWTLLITAPETAFDSPGGQTAALAIGYDFYGIPTNAVNSAAILSEWVSNWELIADGTPMVIWAQPVVRGKKALLQTFNANTLTRYRAKANNNPLITIGRTTDLHGELKARGIKETPVVVEP